MILEIKLFKYNARRWYCRASRCQISTKNADIELRNIRVKDLSYEWLLHSYIGYDYGFIILVLVENIYITIDNVSIFGRDFCPKDVSARLI